LILLTNDGSFAQHVTHPKFEVQKVYEVTISGRLTPAEIDRIARGVPLKDGMTKPAEVEVLRDGTDQQTVEIKLHEGRYHEIRRIMKALNHEVLRLLRREIGPYQLAGLKSGSVRRDRIRNLLEK
jgi:pseudouridine synthase